jgi:hypothetical protein
MEGVVIHDAAPAAASRIAVGVDGFSGHTR